MNLFAKKSLGQHFLNSSHVLGQIISAAQIQKGDRVLEIGPGTGILTRALLDSDANVLAIEKDSRAIDILKEKFKAEVSGNKLQIIEEDILEITKERLTTELDSRLNVKQDLKPSNSTNVLNSVKNKSPIFSLVANIPYYITGAILEKFLEHGPRPDQMVLLVQKEVAERIVARNGKESILSISVKSFGTPKIIAKVRPGAFTPPPSVDSAILLIDNISDRLFAEKNVDISHFFRLVKAGFAHKRKFALSNIRGAIEKLDESQSKTSPIEISWNNLGLDPKIRAEDMTIRNWLDIASNIEVEPLYR